jgi:NADH-quinone oxidoreductase subunit H
MEKEVLEVSYKVGILALESVSYILPLLLAVAYLTLLERKLMASMQRRRGPNVVGIFGLLQPLADGLKLFLKETILPSNANISLFLIAPVLTFMLSLITWGVVPFGENMVFADLDLGILYILAISSLGIYGILISGWASNSKYAFLGGLRSAAQMVSYEVSMGLILCTVLLMAGSLNLSEIVEAQEEIWYVVPLFPLWVIFLISTLAETNRAPFDLPEAEAELVAGYNVEYSAMGFALFFLGEYSNMLVMSGMSVLLFFGGWLPPFSEDSFLESILFWIPDPIWFALKLALIVSISIWARAAFPRFRYDQLMSLGWKVFLPFSLAFFLFIAGVLIAFDWLPPGI